MTLMGKWNWWLPQPMGRLLLVRGSGAHDGAPAPESA
jgi:hypothetical protein